MQGRAREAQKKRKGVANTGMATTITKDLRLLPRTVLQYDPECFACPTITTNDSLIYNAYGVCVASTTITIAITITVTTATTC